MKTRRTAEDAISAIALLEEALHLLRTSGLQALSLYYLGTIPFAVAFLYFWSDMSRGAFADDRCATAALGLAGLFVWMKTMQAFFADALRSKLLGVPPTAINARSVIKCGISQLATQGWGIVLLPLAAMVALPFGWVFAYFQNLTALGTTAATQGELARNAKTQANLWPKQNHLTLVILAAFGFFVFINVFMAMLIAPQLLKMLTGIETTFTRSWSAIFNTTFLATAVVATWMLYDPLIKAVYVLRCFYGASLRTGEDLMLTVRPFLAKAAAIALLFTIFSAVQLPTRAAAATPPNPPPLHELNENIDEVLNRPEFRWRLEREALPPDTKQTFLDRFFDSIAKTLKGWMRSVGRLFSSIIEWLVKKLAVKQKTHAMPSLFEGLAWLRLLLFVLLAVLAAVLAIAITRKLRNRPKTKSTAATAAPKVADVADETVIASELPEGEWLRLANELSAKGEYRLALRALFLATLAHLGHRNLISIARFKSNLEYRNEVSRRCRAFPRIQNAFHDNVFVYDAAWYGLREVTPEHIDHFKQNLDLIRTEGAPA